MYNNVLNSLIMLYSLLLYNVHIPRTC